ncbi:hypothetical protein [Pinirhizobacter sp.]|jgi:hypothetical protein|uniref:hypothetical protein n=1 Tax=Pinirhizobacter sp. TaxID=2950432 RepID=UPI002F408E3B
MKARVRAIVVVAAVAALLACACLGADAWSAWLPPVLFVSGAGMGLLAMGWIHALTGGAWGAPLRPPARAASMLVILAVVAWLPVAWQSPDILSWMHGDLVPAQRWFLSPGFFFIRTAVCLAAMAIFGWAGWRRPVTMRRGVLSLLVYAVVVSMVAVDWVMALVPAWHSAVLGMTLASSQMVSGAAFGLICVASARVAPPGDALLRDLANLLLALTLLWGYLAFMDYLTAWIADQPTEVAWYLPRVATSWWWLSVVMVLLGFVIPLVSLLSHKLKRDPRALRWVAGVALSGQACFLAWLVLPSLRSHGMHAGIADVLAWSGMLVLAWAVVDGAWARSTACFGSRA